jgi:hypothetical protein
MQSQQPDYDATQFDGGAYAAVAYPTNMQDQGLENVVLQGQGLDGGMAQVGDFQGGVPHDMGGYSMDGAGGMMHTGMSGDHSFVQYNNDGVGQMGHQMVDPAYGGYLMNAPQIMAQPINRGMHKQGVPKSLEKLDDDQILREIAMEGKERMENTIVGKVCSYMRARGPMTMSECVEALDNHYEELRKPDGTKYKGTLEKAINGALSSTGVFQKGDDNRWIMKETEVQLYEERVIKKFEQKSKKRKQLSKDGEAFINGGLDKKLRRKYQQQAAKPAAGGAAGFQSTPEGILRVLGRIVSQQTQNGEETPELTQNPFGVEDEDILLNCPEAEAENMLRLQIGEERFGMLMQIYNYFSEVLMRGIQQPPDLSLANMQQGLLQPAVGTGVGGLPKPGQEINMSQLHTLQEQMTALQNRLVAIEDTSVHGDGTQELYDGPFDYSDGLQ